MNETAFQSALEVYAGLEPAAVWRHFAALNSIPRPSGSEAATATYVKQAAEAAGATWQADARGNLVVRMPGGSGAAVAIQSHLDMVCQNRPEVNHDFATEPIRPRREGGLIYATGTTLGADNGIGAAMALALLSDRPGVCPPLELLFTVEEETGLFGAQELDPSLVSARRLLNLDSEDPREITIGCAGGAGVNLAVPIAWEPVPAGWQTWHFTVSGLKGGHSGVQIHEPLANAIKIATEVLLHAVAESVEFRLVRIEGGNAHNAIPRDVTARLCAPASASDALNAAIANAQQVLQARWQNDEPGLKITLSPANPAANSFDSGSTLNLLALLDELPHGVERMSEIYTGKVETSSNLAMVKTTAEISIHVSNRSFREAALREQQEKVVASARQHGAEATVAEGYPGWEPRQDSPLREAAQQVFIRTQGQPPQIEIIHAGLECGILASRLPGLDAISFGPLIRGPHTPEENVDIASVAVSWQFLVALLEELVA